MGTALIPERQDRGYPASGRDGGRGGEQTDGDGALTGLREIHPSTGRRQQMAIGISIPTRRGYLETPRL